MKKITSEWLKKQSACSDGYKWWLRHKSDNPVTVINSLMDDNRSDWANWLIVRVMTHEQQIKYAIFAAEKVIGIYEKQYPDDDRPRKAIEAAKEYLKYPDKTHRLAARAAARAAAASGTTAYATAAANAAANAASYAAASVYFAAHAAAAASDAAAAHTAANAADTAANAADAAADTDMKHTIIEYGISLLIEVEKRMSD